MLTLNIFHTSSSVSIVNFEHDITGWDILTNVMVLLTKLVAGLYSSIPHKVCLRALRHDLKNRNYNEIPTKNLIKMVEFVLRNNYFEFDSSIFQQILGTGIGTKFILPHACILMDQHKTKFLETQILNGFVILMIFSIYGPKLKKN